MAKSKETYVKREKEKKRIQKRLEKAERKEERKSNNQKGKPVEEMFAYLDEHGNLTSAAPEKAPANKN